MREPAGLDFFRTGITSDGLLVGAFYRVGTGDDATETPDIVHSVALVDPRDGTSRVLRRPTRPKVQPSSFAADDRFVVWIETADVALLVTDWEMYVHDRRSGRTRLLAAARRGPDGTYSPAYAPEPSVFGGRAVWSVVEERAGAEPQLVAYHADLTHEAEPAVLAVDAARPRISHDRIVFVRRAGERKGRLVTVKRDGRSERDVPGTDGVGSFAIAGADIVWARLDDTGEVLVSSDDAVAPRLVTSQPELYPEFFVAAEGVVAWRQQNAQMLWIQASDRIATLADQPGDPDASGRFIVFNRRINGKRVDRILDVTDLAP